MAPERACDVLKQAISAGSLDAFLEVMGEQIDALQLADGYLINLPDASSSNLFTRKLHFPSEFKMLEQTTLGHRHSLEDNYLNARVFRARKVDCINHDNANEMEKTVLQYWRATEISGVPILDCDRPQAEPLGVVVLMNQSSGIEAAALAPLQDLLSLLYPLLKNWLHHARLQEMQEQAKAAVAENRRLLQFLDEMSSLTAIDKVYELFAAELFRQLRFDIAAFGLVENEMLVNKKVSIADQRYAMIADEWRRYLQEQPVPLDPRFSGASYTIFQNESTLFPDLEAIRHLPMTPYDTKTMEILRTPRTLFISPIRYQKKPIGGFALYSLSEPIALAESDVNLLEQLSSFLGTAIVNSQTYAISQAQNIEIRHLNMQLQEKVKTLAEQATTDQLTGLLNFRSFEQELTKRLKDCKRMSDKHELSLALLDIDHFKAFNDTHGHAAGNDILAGVAKEIGKLVRQTDIAFRYGGEEFVLILPQCPPEGTVQLAERIRKAIEARVFDTCAGRLSVTISIGCTMYLPNDDQQSFFKRADVALYKAKNTGRNRVCSI
jgi:diguanylate cyclase (GGDEF)-like protein